MIIVIDSREQHPLTFRKSLNLEGTIIKKLDVGDYSIQGYEDKICIERKSAADLFQTLGKGHKRFRNELERAKNLDHFFVIVENPFMSVYNKDFANSHWINMRGDVIIQICFTLKLKYGIDFIFCNNRNEATAMIRQIFNAFIKLEGAKK